jgi:hypothetical protein
MFPEGCDCVVDATKTGRLISQWQLISRAPSIENVTYALYLGRIVIVNNFFC